MSVLARKRGAWINQYSQPSHAVFLNRARQVDYVVIHYGLAAYEESARQFGVMWGAERMGESGVGSQDGPSHAVQYATELAAQANQGAAFAVINLEEADGGWHADDGWATLKLVNTFRQLAPGKPLFASLDTRGSRPNSPYQRAAASLCDGVMPMVYPKAFGQSAPLAFASAITPLVRSRWTGKEIHPTYQTYDNADVPSQMAEVSRLYAEGIINGANSYTLGHATEAQWLQSLTFNPVATQPVPRAPDVQGALIALRKLWVEGWHTIEQNGTAGEATAFADFWQRVLGLAPVARPA